MQQEQQSPTPSPLHPSNLGGIPFFKTSLSLHSYTVNSNTVRTGRGLKKKKRTGRGLYRKDRIEVVHREWHISKLGLSNFLIIHYYIFSMPVSSLISYIINKLHCFYSYLQDSRFMEMMHGK